MAISLPRLASTGRSIDPSRRQNAGQASLGQLSADRRGGALVEYLILGLVAIFGLHALPKLDASTSKKLRVQAECGLLNADCGAASGSGSAQATPVGGTPGEQGKPARRAPSRRLVPRSGPDPAIMHMLVSLASSIKDLSLRTPTNEIPKGWNAGRAVRQR